MKMLVIGLDGATLDLVQPWADAGYLPHLQHLMVEGARGRLESTLPPVTAAAWASFMTGKHPAGHGVFDFFRGRAAAGCAGYSGYSAGATELVDAGFIAGPTLWALLSQAGLRTGVLNVPITHPPEAVNGFLVPGLLSPDQGATTYPPGWLESYRGELGPYRLTPRLSYRPGNEAAFIAELHDVLAVQLRYALRLAADHPTDFLMVHFLVTDIAQHALWRFLDPAHPWYEQRQGERFGDAVRDLFAAVDEGIGRLRDLLPADASVIVLSDHGFGPLHRVANLNLFFHDRGLLAIKPEAIIRYRLCRNRLSRPLAWRLATWLGQARGALSTAGTPRKLIDFDDVNWSRTYAYSMGHLGQVYVNLRGREPGGIVAPADYANVRQRVADALLDLRDPDSDQLLVKAVVTGEEAGAGPYQASGPDLHVIFADGVTAYPLFAADGRVVSEQRHGNSGDHRRDGLVIMAGPPIRRGVTIDGAAIVDLAPTILYLFGLPVPDEMDGRVLTQALAPGAADLQPSHPPTPADPNAAPPSARPGEGALTPAEQTVVRQQLRALGYLA